MGLSKTRSKALLPADMQPLQPKKTSKVRQSNFELLRIILMLMIVVHHLRGYGLNEAMEGAPLLSRMLVSLIGFGGQVGVDGFVLISGYFMCRNTTFQPKKLLKLYLQMLFFAVGGYLVLCAAGLSPFNLKDFLFFLFPVTQRTFWFATTYFFLLLFSPYLGMLIQKMDKKEHQRLLVAGIAVFSLVPSLIQVRYEIPNLLWFFLLYFLAAYIRLYPSRWFERKWLALGVAALSYLAAISYPSLRAWMATWFPAPPYLPSMLTTRYSITILLCALGLFLFFKNLNIKGNRGVNMVASATFGVYLLHEHGPRMRNLLWLEWFDCRPYLQQPGLLMLRIALAVLIVFAAGIAIDLIRQYALERPLFRLLDKRAAKKTANDIAS